MKLFSLKLSLAWRLTILYALSLFFLLSIAAGLLDWFLTSDMKRDNNQFLASEMLSLRTLLRQRPNDVRAWQEEIEREAVGSVSGYARYYVRILDEQQHMIVETSGMSGVLGTHFFPAPLPAHARKLSGISVTGADGRPFTVVSQWVTLYRPEARKRLIQLALDRSRDEETIADYRQNALFLLLGGVLCAGSFGLFIARTGLRPLTKLTRVFTRITPDHLNEQVDFTHWPREIAQLANAFDSMLQRLERSFAMLSQFSADLAHELRTPIANLRGEAEVVLGKPRSAEEYRWVIESSIEEYERLSKVIDNLLFLARTDTHNMAVRLSSVNVRQEIEALLGYFDVLAEEKKIEIALSGNALLDADAVLFRRALTNLLSNAFQYTPQNGRITVDVAKHNGTTQITVADTGIGIERACLEKVLDRFFRTEKARTMHSQGSGLGLAIVKSIMDLHSGTVEIESTPGKGTTVRLRFPRP